MRRWSLNTARWMCFQGTAFHPYTGVAAVLMASALLLVPLPSTPPCLRQRIRRLSRRRWLLRQSPRRAHAVGTYSVYRPPRGATRRLPRSCCPFCATVGPHSPPEPLWGALDTDSYQTAAHSRLGRPLGPRYGPVSFDGG